MVIVGGGAAGLSAALSLGRARRRVVVLDNGQPRNRFAAHMHGVLGQEGADPREFLARGRDEVAGYGVEVVGGAASQVETTDAGVRVTADDGRVIEGRMLVVASGMDDVLPDIPGLAERWGTTVLHCPYCHGWEVGGQRLGVIATSPMSLHQVRLLRQWSDDLVFFAAAAGEIDADARAALEARGIAIITAPVTGVTSRDRALAVATEDGGSTPLDAVFVAGALRPRDGFLSGLGLERTESPFGSFLTVDAAGRTSHPRVWAAGNVAEPMLNVAMSVSAGAVVAATVNMALVDEDFEAALA